MVRVTRLAVISLMLIAQSARGATPVDLTGLKPLVPEMADRAAIAAGGGGMTFTFKEPGQRHVWIADLAAPLLLDRHPVLVMKYRATNIARDRDFVVLFESPGTNPMIGARGDQLKVDGKEQTLRVDMRRRLAVGKIPFYDWRSPATQVAIGLTGGTGKAAPAFELLSLHLEPAVAEDDARAMPGERYVTLTIIDAATQQPLANIPVQFIVDCDRLFDRRITDAAGRVRIALPAFKPAANYMMIAEAPGRARTGLLYWYEDRSKDQTIAVPDAAVLAVNTGANVHGRIVDAAGSPVPYARLLFSFIIDRGGDERQSGNAVASSYDLVRYTDAQGRWEVDCVPKDVDRMRLTVTHAEHPPTHTELAMQSEPIDTVVASGARALVLVRDAGGYPLYHAALAPGEEHTVVSDLLGRFRWATEGAAEPMLLVGKPGLAAQRRTELVTDPAHTPVFELTAGATMMFHAVNADGEPVTGAMIKADRWGEVSNHWPNWFMPTGGKTNADGDVTVRGVPDGETQYSLKHDAYGTKKVTLAPDGEVHVITLGAKKAK